MALITCKNCGRPVSDKAPACPHCGAEIEPAATQARPEPSVEFVPDAEESDKPTISPMVAIIAIAIIAIGAIAGYYLYQQEMERQRAEFVRDSLAQVERERIAAEQARLAAEKARQDSIRRVHETIVNGYLAALRKDKQSIEEYEDVSYFLYDITRDNVPELLIARCENIEGMCGVSVYGYCNGMVEEILSTGDVSCYGNDYLIGVDYEFDSNRYRVYKYEWNGSKLVKSDLFGPLSDYDEIKRRIKEPNVSWIDGTNERPIINMF